MISIRETFVFNTWLSALRDDEARLRIIRRLQRVERGLLGDAKPVGGGVLELRVDYGPGYRLYFIRRGEVLIVLLCGGTKNGQRRDIARAQDMALLERE